MLNVFPLDSTELASLGEDPLVSVIIDNYNYERFLGQAIDSVLDQTYSNVELIVVDDGSTDNSRNVIESYGDRLIPIFQKNSGQGSAFNSGIIKAQGQIVCLLDADDYFHPEKLARVVANFQAHPEWVQIAHHCISVDAEGQTIRTGASKTLSQGDVRPLLLKQGKYRSTRTSALAYRRGALLKVLPINTQKLPADSYLVAAVPFYGQVGSINEPLMFYRIHGSNFHARSIDLDYHTRGREAIAHYINETAANVGLSERLNLENDADYRTFKALQLGGVSRLEALQVIWITLQESLSMGRTAREIVVRLTWGAICILFPEEGKQLLQVGLGSYLQQKFLGLGRKLWDRNWKLKW